MTTYEHDPEGRLVRSVTVWDPEWTEDDLEGFFEWQHEHNNTCLGCGLPLSETTDPDAEGRWDAVGIRCHACKVKGARQKQFQGDQSGMLWFPKRI